GGSGWPPSGWQPGGQPEVEAPRGSREGKVKTGGAQFPTDSPSLCRDPLPSPEFPAPELPTDFRATEGPPPSSESTCSDVADAFAASAAASVGTRRRMKSLKNFLSFKVPDNSAYEQRVYTEDFCFQEKRRLRWRCSGAGASVLALILYANMLHPASHWTAGPAGGGGGEGSGRGSAWSGLWDACFLLAFNKTVPHELQHISCEHFVPDWQKAIIGLLFFSVLFAAIGSVLAVCGLCAGHLPRKMYYYHSAGEIFFVSAVATTIAVGVYPYVVQRFVYQSASYGYGYGLGWVTAGLLYLASLSMMLDDLVRESSRPRPWTVLCCFCPAVHRSGDHPQPV
uniref:Transmembrane protein n=1 Tax=Macrostomum lignano TaxID=282301 RepID=A0A1I8GV57_9PLAT